MEIDIEPWWKLFDRDRAVGFKRNSGRFAFFSTDGYGWSGTPKKADLAVRELPIRDHDNHRLFEGDVISATWMGRQDAYLAIVDAEGTCFLGSTGGALADVTIEEMGRDLCVHRNLGNIFVNPGLQADFDKCIRRLQTRGKHFLVDKILMSMGVVAAVLTGCFFQLQWFGVIGPLLTIASLLVGISLFLLARTLITKKWMTRGAIFAITPTVSATVAFAVSAFFSIFMQNFVDAAATSVWLSGITLWITLFLLCFGAIPITAQLLGFQAMKPVHRDSL